MMIEAAVLGAALLVGIGIVGLLTARNLVAILVSLQLMAKGVVLALVLAGIAGGQPELGQGLAITAVAIDTVTTAVGLALAVQVWRRFGTLDIQALRRTKG